MAYNKIIYDNQTLVDLTEDTVTPTNLLEGITAHDKTGAEIIGTLNFSDILALERCTCYQIQQIVKRGLASSLWAVGDRIPITLNGKVSTYSFDNETWYAFIIGFDHNMELETKGQHNLTLQFGETQDGIDIAFVDPIYDESIETTETGFRMNLTNTNVGGWYSSWMRNTVCSAFFNALPNEWQNIISTISKYTDNQGNAIDEEWCVSATEEQIFLLAPYEIVSKDNTDILWTRHPNEIEASYQQIYDYYVNHIEREVKYKSSNIEVMDIWWTRSPTNINSGGFIGTSDVTNSSFNNFRADRSNGFTPCFCIT